MFPQQSSRELLDLTVDLAKHPEGQPMDADKWESWKNRIAQDPLELMHAKPLMGTPFGPSSADNLGQYPVSPLFLMLTTWSYDQLNEGLQWIGQHAELGSNPWVTAEMPWFNKSIKKSDECYEQLKKVYGSSGHNLSPFTEQPVKFRLYKWLAHYFDEKRLQPQVGMWDILCSRFDFESEIEARPVVSTLLDLNIGLDSIAIPLYIAWLKDNQYLGIHKHEMPVHFELIYNELKTPEQRQAFFKASTQIQTLLAERNITSEKFAFFLERIQLEHLLPESYKSRSTPRI